MDTKTRQERRGRWHEGALPELPKEDNPGDEKNARAKASYSSLILVKIDLNKFYVTITIRISGHP